MCPPRGGRKHTNKDGACLSVTVVHNVTEMIYGVEVTVEGLNGGKRSVLL